MNIAVSTTRTISVRCSKDGDDPYWQADAWVAVGSGHVEGSARSYSKNKALAYVLEDLAAKILKEEVR